MSDPSKTWALLTARALQFSQAPGGTPFLTAAEAAQLLHGLPASAFLAGMAKECQDLTCISQLEGRLFDWAVMTGFRASWPEKHRYAYARRFAGLAVYELLIPRPYVCRACKGLGYTTSEQGNGIQCDECGSTGGRAMSEKLRSDLVGITWSIWRTEWSVRYHAVFAELTCWHQQALSHVARAVKSIESAA